MFSCVPTLFSRECLAGPFYLIFSNNSLHGTKYDNSLRTDAIILQTNELKLTRWQGKLSYTPGEQNL